MKNREIKFRAWDKERERMLYDEKLTLLNLNCTEVADINFALNRKFLMQYTGLKDKNGKEVYEGDVVEYVMKNGFPEDFYKARAEVKFVNGLYEPFYDELGFHEIREFHPYDFEVIGNIYENPELLVNSKKGE